MEAPSAAELQNDPTVRAAFAAAWADSFPDDPLLRHEEGGFIYYNPTAKTLTIRRTRPGRTSELDLSSPPVVQDCYLVGIYHTHPTLIGFMPDPSIDDHKLADEAGIPFFTISEEQTYVIGPDRRIGGCTGPTGYPI